MARQLRSIECSAQPLCMSFHPLRDVVAAGLVDGTVEGEMSSLPKWDLPETSLELMNVDL
jgi:hypothetical protein